MERDNLERIAERARAENADRVRRENECPNCPGKQLAYVSPINTGASNEEGAYLQSLYQCPCCKIILVK